MKFRKEKPTGLFNMRILMRIPMMTMAVGILKVIATTEQVIMMIITID